MPAAKAADGRVVKPLVMALGSNLRLLLKHCVARSRFAAAPAVLPTSSVMSGAPLAMIAVSSWVLLASAYSPRDHWDPLVGIAVDNIAATTGVGAVLVRGKVVAVVGAPGAGTSTVAMAVAQAFGQIGRAHVNSSH